MFDSLRRRVATTVRLKMNVERIGNRQNIETAASKDGRQYSAIYFLFTAEVELSLV